jgi:hypothetical protein
VRSDVRRDSLLAECFDDIARLQFPCDTDGRSHTAELVDDAQHPEHLAIVHGREISASEKPF